MNKYANVDKWITYTLFCGFVIFCKTFMCLTKLWIKVIIYKKQESIYSMTKNLTTIELAFLGDAVHTLYVRKNIVDGDKKINAYHNIASKYCCATRQSKVLDKIYDELTEEEKDLVRRTRNAKIHHSAKNSTEEDYKKATCFEALIGFLYVSDDKTRLEKFLKCSMEDM